MAKAQKDTSVSLGDMALEEGIPGGDVSTPLPPKSSEELAKDIDRALIEERKEPDTAPSEPTFRPPEEEVPPAAPEKDTAEEETALERVMEKKGYKSPEDVARAYEELEKLMGRRDGYPQEEAQITPKTQEPLRREEPESYDWYWEKKARDPIGTEKELWEQWMQEKAEAFQRMAREATTQRLAFEGEAKKRLPYWAEIEGNYNRNLQLGMDFGSAFKEAELTHLRGHYHKGYSKGLEDKTTKEQQAANAQIEGSVAKPEIRETEITPEEFAKLSIAEMEKLLPHKY